MNQKTVCCLDSLNLPANLANKIKLVLFISSALVVTRVLLILQNKMAGKIQIIQTIDGWAVLLDSVLLRSNQDKKLLRYLSIYLESIFH